MTRKLPPRAARPPRSNWWWRPPLKRSISLLTRSIRCVTDRHRAAARGPWQPAVTHDRARCLPQRKLATGARHRSYCVGCGAVSSGYWVESEDATVDRRVACTFAPLGASHNVGHRLGRRCRAHEFTARLYSGDRETGVRSTNSLIGLSSNSVQNCETRQSRRRPTISDTAYFPVARDRRELQP
jgi:hypothetical protein